MLTELTVLEGLLCPLIHPLFIIRREMCNEDSKKLPLTSKCFIDIGHFTDEHFFLVVFHRSPSPRHFSSTDKKH